MFQEEKLVKKRKLCEIGSNLGSMEDRISQLPKDLICRHILSRLRTVDAVKTSALSTKWRHLWKSVPHLGLHSRRFSTSNDFVTFINKFLYSYNDSWMRKFQLRIYDCDFSKEWVDDLFIDNDNCYVTQWIGDVLTRQKIQHLDVSFGNSACAFLDIPVSLYTCETLVHLRFVGINMLDSEFVSLPCLKSIYLRKVTCPNVTILEKLISSSPVLEDLTILASLLYNADEKALHLRSQTLERISVDDLGARINVVVIDAPLLQCFKIKREIFAEETITIYSGVSPKVQVHVKIFFVDLFYDPDYSTIQDNLTNISIMVTDLVITRNAFKYLYLFSYFVELLPQFGYVSCLDVNLCVLMLKWFPSFLESFPNLKTLSMRLQASSKKKRNIRFKSVPNCLLSSLECVNIKTMVSEDAIEVKVVKYFLQNAMILKKLTLQLSSHPRKDDIFNEILKLPRRSIASQLELL